MSKNVEPLEVQVSAIHDLERSRFWNQDIEDIDVAECSRGDFNKRGDVSSKVQEGMHFDGGFMFAERGPGKDRQAKVDRRGIQGVGGFLQFNAEVFIGVKGPLLLPRTSQYRLSVHVTHRLRRWLCKKHKVQGKGEKRYPNQYLYDELGLINLPRRTHDLPWAKA